MWHASCNSKDKFVAITTAVSHEGKEQELTTRRIVVKMKMRMNSRTYWGGAALLAVLAVAGPACAEEASVGDTLVNLAYALDTFTFL